MTMYKLLFNNIDGLNKTRYYMCNSRGEAVEVAQCLCHIFEGVGWAYRVETV